MRRFSLLTLPVIALLLSNAIAEPYQYGVTFNGLQTNVNYQALPQVQPLPPVDSAQPADTTVGQIPAALEPMDNEGSLLLTSFDDPLMAPGEPTFDPLGPEMAAFIKKNAWKKGKFTITPYGYAQADVIYETNPSTRTDYALFVNRQTHGDRPQFGVDAKSSRLGVIIGGPNCCFLGQGFKTAATFEINFQGQFQFYNKPGILFRRGFVEMENSRWRFLAGQEWDVISPLNPGTLNYSVAFFAGNIDYRRPQLRIERKIRHSSNFKTLLQFSVNHSIAIDGDWSTTDTIVDYNSKWPILEGRVAWTLGHRKPMTVGISGHVGQENYDFLFPVNPVYNVDRLTWSGNLDAKIPLTRKLTLESEFFIGENLAMFFGGIGQGVNPNTGNGIRSIGGWVQLEYKWNSRWRSYVGYTIDDPLNQDLAATQRCRNQSIYLNALYNINKDFELGMEVSQWQTGYIGQATYELTRLQWMARYKF